MIHFPQVKTLRLHTYIEDGMTIAPYTFKYEANVKVLHK